MYSPKSSVVEKEFYTVPLEYASDGGDSKETGFYKKTSTETGEETVVFITPTIFEEDDNYYLTVLDNYEANLIEYTTLNKLMNVF